MKLPRYIFILVVLLVFALVTVSLMYIWFPEFVPADTFVRVFVSFGVLLAGSALLVAVGKRKPDEPEEKSKKAH